MIKKSAQVPWIILINSIIIIICVVITSIDGTLLNNFIYNKYKELNQTGKFSWYAFLFTFYHPTDEHLGKNMVVFIMFTVFVIINPMGKFLKFIKPIKALEYLIITIVAMTLDNYIFFFVTHCYGIGFSNVTIALSTYYLLTRLNPLFILNLDSSFINLIRGYEVLGTVDIHFIGFSSGIILATIFYIILIINKKKKKEREVLGVGRRNYVYKPLEY